MGTLVVVLDRAKNLPNRKAIGKQDAYCVARLGKHAKRTEPDKRGGQTPRWDKELRFPVHDSADYRTLKVVLFSEDKKTELIGETNISLDNILDAAGGGQADGWHTCKCRDKYAGDIRVELTFWDERPREAAPLVVETRKEAPMEQYKEPKKIELLGGPRVPPGGTEGGSLVFASKPKRRPLPPDPTAHLAIEDAPKAKSSTAPALASKSKDKEKHRHREHRDQDRDRGHDQDRPRHHRTTKDEKRREHRDKTRRHHEHDDRQHGYEDDAQRTNAHRYDEYPEYDDHQYERDDYPPAQHSNEHYREDYDHYRDGHDNRMYQDHHHQQQHEAQPVAAQTMQSHSHYMTGEAPIDPQRQNFYDAQTHIPPQQVDYHQQQSQGMLVLHGDAPPPLVPSRGARQSQAPAAYAAPAQHGGQVRGDYHDQQPSEYQASGGVAQDYRQFSGQHPVEPLRHSRSQELVPYGAMPAPTVPSHEGGLDRLNLQQMAFNPQTQTFELVSSTTNQPPQMQQLQMQQPPPQLQQPPLQPPLQLQQVVQYQQPQPPQLPPQPQQTLQYQQHMPVSSQQQQPAPAPQSMQLMLRGNEEPSSPPPPPPQHHSLAAIANAAPANPPASSIALVSYMAGAPPPPAPSHRDRQVRMSMPATIPAQPQQQVPIQPPQYQQQPPAQVYQPQPPLQQQTQVQQNELVLYQSASQPAPPAHQELMATQAQLPPSLQAGYKAYQPQVYQPVGSQPPQPQQALVLASQGYDAPQIPEHSNGPRGLSEPPAYSSLEAANPETSSSYQNRVPSQSMEVSPAAQIAFQEPQAQQNQLMTIARYGSGYEMDSSSSYSNPTTYSNPSAPVAGSYYTSEPEELPMLQSNTVNAGALALYDPHAPPPLPRKAHAAAASAPPPPAQDRSMEQYSAQQQVVYQQPPQELPHNMSQREPSWSANVNYDARRRSSPLPPQKPPVAEHSNYHKPSVRDVTGRPSLESRRSLSPIPPPAAVEHYDQPSYNSMGTQQRSAIAPNSRNSQYGSEQPRQPSYTSSDYSTSGHSAVSNVNSNYSYNDAGYDTAITSAGNSWTPTPGSHFRHNSESSLPSYDRTIIMEASGGRRTPPNNRAKSRSRDPKNVSFDLESESSYSSNQVPIIKPRATSPNPGSRGPSPAPYSNPPPVHPLANKRAVPPERRMTVGIPFSPDSYDAINPVATFSTSPIARSPVGGLSTSPAARSPGAIASSPGHYMSPKDEKAARKKEEKIARKAAKKRISTPGSQNRALHDDDILPEETYAPEPDQQRRNSFMGDDDEDTPSVTPLNIMPSKGPRELHSRRTKPAESANKLQKVRPSKSIPNMTSSSTSSGRPRPLPGPPNAIMAPGDHYDHEQDSYNRRATPQKPPKIPLDRGNMSRDEWALSQELSGISIGSSSRRRTVGFR